MLGVPKYTLRYCEREFEEFKPPIPENGEQRRYTQVEIKMAKNALRAQISHRGGNGGA